MKLFKKLKVSSPNTTPNNNNTTTQQRDLNSNDQHPTSTLPTMEVDSMSPHIITTIRSKLLRHPRLSKKFPDQALIREEVIQEYADAQYIYEKHFSLKKLREMGLQPHHPFKFKFALTNLCHFKANKMQGILYTLPSKFINLEYGPTHSALVIGPYMLHWYVYISIFVCHKY
jgi:hypothetical protein